MLPHTLLLIMTSVTSSISPATGWQTGVTTFDSFDDAFIQISTKSHSVRGNLTVFRRNTRRLHLKCKEGACLFEAYVSYDKKQASYILRRFEGEHTCVGVQEQKRGSLHSAAYVESKVRPQSCTLVELTLLGQRGDDSHQTDNSKTSHCLVPRPPWYNPIPHRSASSPCDTR